MLSRLPLRGSASFIDIDIREGTMIDAQNWHAVVQPHINTQQRIDALWDWPALYTNCMVLEAGLGRKVSLQCIDIPNAHGESVPLAMMLLSVGYPALDGSYNGSVFLWYLAAAPGAALTAMGVLYQKPMLILQALIDTAIQLSSEQGYDGRVALHAAQAGKHELYCKYRDDARMLTLRHNAVLSLGRRMKGGNDGRYFWTDPKLAQSLSNSLDYLR
ncbi:hypothetical protein [Massilia aquatica]|uniref:Uncharacterized protein n=1 Tax=Massilia aquatica TaxID=2609000 RepID=A0ABX0MCA7_9BURK|nr:hypothetical protein [Massilia aquatica]NHZ44303.1 hypothetical protein [Massilia aquatica]